MLELRDFHGTSEEGHGRSCGRYVLATQFYFCLHASSCGRFIGLSNLKSLTAWFGEGGAGCESVKFVDAGLIARIRPEIGWILHQY